MKTASIRMLCLWLTAPCRRAVKGQQGTLNPPVIRVRLPLSYAHTGTGLWLRNAALPTRPQEQQLNWQTLTKPPLTVSAIFFIPHKNKFGLYGSRLTVALVQTTVWYGTKTAVCYLSCYIFWKMWVFSSHGGDNVVNLKCWLCPGESPRLQCGVLN